MNPLCERYFFVDTFSMNPYSLCTAGVVELGDAGDSKSPGPCACAGSTPASGTKRIGDGSSEPSSYVP